MTRAPRHTAPHALPISNGYGYSYQDGGDPENVAVRCRRCPGNFEPDEQWVERYFAARRRDAASALDRGRLSFTEHATALNELAAKEVRVLRAIL